MTTDRNTPAPAFPDDDTLRRVRAGFAAAGYDEPTLCAALGSASWTELAARGAAALSHQARALPASARTLFGLFALGAEPSPAEADAALGPELVAALSRSGLVERSAAGIRAAVALTPLDRLLIAADPIERHAARAADFVLGPGGVTRHLANLALPGRVGALLDLGSGAGTLGALAAHRAERVVCTDVNPRAVAFSRFNAALNGLTNVESRTGSLFEPVAGERFDLVLCNPPYVLSPDATFAYRDGGGEICPAIVRAAAEHLTKTGTLQMLAEWPERAGAPWQEEVASWLRDVPCDAWVLRTRSENAEAYASRWLLQEYGSDAQVPADAFARWVGHLEDRGIGSVGGGLLVLRPTRRAAPIRCLRAAPRIGPGAGPSLACWLAGQALLAEIEHEGALLDVVLTPADGLEQRSIRAPTGEGSSAGDPQLVVTRGLEFGVRTDPVAAELIAWLDGRRTPREALARLAERMEVDEAPFLASLPAALARLVALGILHPGAADA